jgi:hypothetical protein
MAESISRWSFSSLQVYEKCPLAAKKKHIDKIPTEQHPAAERGNQIHKAAEDYIQGITGELPEILEGYRGLMDAMATEVLNGTTLIEGEWGFDRDWNPVAYDAPNCWVRGKLDIFRFLEPHKGEGRDWKTGKQYPPKHLQQEQLYVVMGFSKYEALQEMDFVFDYVDQKAPNNKTHRSYTRERHYTRLRENFTKRGLIMTSDTEFNPRPSRINCMWCDFRNNCEWAVK